MATEFSVILANSDAHLVDPALDALERLDEIESRLTIYNTDSEVSRINSESFHREVEISADTFHLFQRSLNWSRWTDGAFDITAGPLVRAWGFAQRRAQKPKTDQVNEALQKVGYQHVKLNHANQSVRFTRPGMEINLGAIGKGYALDTLAAELEDRGVRNFLLHGGGSSILARGQQEAGSENGWAVGISHPTKPKVRLAGIRLQNEALSTSGTGKQFFHHRGKRYGHVIDPRTGYPAGELLSLTSVAANATDAEASSTGYFVFGIESIKEILEEPREGVPAAKLIGIQSRSRQDDVAVLAFSEFDWVDLPKPPPSRGSG